MRRAMIGHKNENLGTVVALLSLLILLSRLRLQMHLQLLVSIVPVLHDSQGHCMKRLRRSLTLEPGTPEATGIMEFMNTR